MTTEPPQQLLKIFSGPHTGAEVLLGDGETVVGSEDGCDVILNDQFVDPQHVRISLAAGNVRLVPVAGATVLVGGKPVPAEGVGLPPFEYFTLGTTHLAIGPSESPWPHRSFPDFQLAAAAETPASEPAPPAAPEDSSPPAPSTTASSRRRRLYALTGGAICLLLVLLWLAVQFFGNGSVDVAAEPGPPGVAELAAVLRAQQAEKLVQLSERGGRYRAEGYVPTVQRRRTLERELKRLAPSIELRLWDDETLLSGVRRLLELHQLELEAACGEPGEVIVRGTVPAEGPWELAQKSIREDLRCLRKLTDLVAVEGASDSPAARLAQGKGNSAALRADSRSPSAGPADPAVGTLAEAEPRQPAGLGPMWEALRAQVAGLQIGHTQSLVLENGDRLFIGSALEGGYVVQAIEPDAVVCSNGVQRIKLSLRSPE